MGGEREREEEEAFADEYSPTANQSFFFCFFVKTLN